MTPRLRKIVQCAAARRRHHRHAARDNEALVRLTESVLATGEAAELSDGELWERVGTWADTVGLRPEQEAELNELLARFEERAR